MNDLSENLRKCSYIRRRFLLKTLPTIQSMFTRNVLTVTLVLKNSVKMYSETTI